MAPKPEAAAAAHSETFNTNRPRPDSSGEMSQTPSEVGLRALQCHFTWDLDSSRSKLFCLRDQLEDIGPEEGYSWLGHIYNLQGFIHHQLGFAEDALRFLSRAAEALRQMRNTVTDEGPWLVVNYGNLAWLHHHLGERAESRSYLLKVAALLDEHPSPSPDQLHPEICAEKAWTLMKFGPDEKLLAVEYFQSAIRMQPDVVAWHSSHVLALNAAFQQRGADKDTEIFEKMKIARGHDPENLYLAALYLEACAKKGRKIEAEARQLARRILRKPVSSYSGFRPLLRLYRTHLSMDEAVDLAEEALERHTDQRFLKDCVANCYRWRILLRVEPLEQSMVDRAVSLQREVISLYPHSSLKRKIALANVCTQSDERQAEARQIFAELLEGDHEPADAQMLYSCYAKHLHSALKQSYESIEYHMRTAAIQHRSDHRASSIRILERIRDRNRNRMCGEIGEFLATLRR